ncbi:hypothetical protein ACWIUD_06165, partial [Helicobacter sp. 23-1044]
MVICQNTALQKRHLPFFSRGGGFFLNADELRDICTNLYNCTIDSPYSEVTNNGNLALTGRITLGTNGAIDTFINYGDIDTSKTNETFGWGGGSIRNLINYGTMGGFGQFRNGAGESVPMSVTNYGTMNGISTQGGTGDITIANYGVINVNSNNRQHLRDAQYYFYVIKDWAMIIDESQSTFNSTTTPTGNNSHLVTNTQNVRFADGNSKMILDFGNNFELDKAYLLEKLIINDYSGANGLKVDFDRLTTRSELYTLKQSGDYFIVTIDTANSTIGTLYKSNIRTMSNFSTISNALIYPHKYKGTK